MHQALTVDLDVVTDAELLCRSRQHHLEELAIPNRHGDVQIGDVVQRVGAVVDLEIQMERFGQMSSLDERGDTALDSYVAAQEVGRAVDQPRHVCVHAGRRVFGGHDRDAQHLTQSHVVVQVLLCQRVLEPAVVELLQRASHAHRLVQRVAPHRVQHQLEVRARRPRGPPGRRQYPLARPAVDGSCTPASRAT